MALATLAPPPPSGLTRDAAPSSLRSGRGRGRRQRRHGHRPELQRTVVLIPAHNEEQQIGAALESVLAQTYRPDLIVVVADNCTDRTVEIARSYERVLVMETVDNAHRKAGALNQAWWRYCQDARFVLTMDADTVLDPRCLERMRAQAVDEPEIGGLCGRPLTKPRAPGTSGWGALLWRLLALDFAMYDQSLARRKYATEVLGGFGSLFRNRALRDVAERHGNPWAVDSIVEDYRLSLYLRESGWKIQVTPHALAYTDTPVTLRELWRQRIRWTGGTFEELVREGWKPWTRRNWLTFAMVWFGILVRLAGVAGWVLVLTLGIPMGLSWFWLLPVVVASADRLASSMKMRNATPLDHLLAAAVLPLELLSLVGQAWAARSTWLVLRRRSLSW